MGKLIKEKKRISCKSSVNWKILLNCFFRLFVFFSMIVFTLGKHLIMFNAFFGLKLFFNHYIVDNFFFQVHVFYFCGWI